jgi:hypothetical protein
MTLTAGSGGGLSVASTALLQSCHLINNSADVNGGAYYNDFGATSNLTTCKIHANSAGQAGGGWFVFGSIPNYSISQDAEYLNNKAACCYASGYGSQFQRSNATTSGLTCADNDSGENNGNCCYGTQYSDGSVCQQCLPGADCSVVGTSLMTQSLLPGNWRASNTTTDVRPCWFAEACSGSRANTAANATATTSAAVAAVTGTQSGIGSDNTYCAAAYEGPCKYLISMLLSLCF